MPHEYAVGAYSTYGGQQHEKTDPQSSDLYVECGVWCYQERIEAGGVRY